MAVVIGELSTQFEIQDEVKIRRLVREEIRRYMNAAMRNPEGSHYTADPANPAAADTPSAERGG